MGRTKKAISEKDKRALSTYRKTHWGERGKGRVSEMHVPNPLTAETMVELGKLVSVTYRTTKGGDGGEEVDYEHTFGPGENGETDLPVLLFAPKDGPKKKGGLLIGGGNYTVSVRGIVG